MRLILGSASPRRLALLAQIGVVPDEVRPPDVDETPVKQERPRDYCRRIAHAKATRWANSKLNDIHSTALHAQFVAAAEGDEGDEGDDEG